VQSILPGTRSAEAIAAIGLAGAAIVFGLLAWRLRRHPPGGREGHLASSLALATALLVIATLTLAASRRSGEAVQIVLMPFQNLIDALDGEGGLRFAVAELVGNVLLFVPLGMALRWRLPRVGVARLTIVAMLVSVTIETLQAILGTGRWATTTDVITNTVGGLLGAIVGGAWIRPTRDP
jgi:glycopeptide antibiotics resistance protein